MNWIESLGEISWLGVGIASLAAFALGFIWYHWAVFGKRWATALGMTKQEADNVEGMGGVFACSVISGIGKAIIIAQLIEATNTNGLAGGLLFGTVIGVAFTVTSVFYHDGFARRPIIVSCIDSAHDVVELSLMGAVYSAF